MKKQNQKETTQRQPAKRNRRPALPTIRKHVSPEWHDFWLKLSPGAKAYLGKFVRMFAPTITDPTLIRDEHTVAWHGQLVRSGSVTSPIGHVNTAIGKWNAAAPKFGLRILTPLPNRNQLRAEQIRGFPQGLRDEIDELIARLPEPEHPETPAKVRNRLYDAIDVLTSQGRRPESFRDIANALDLDAFVRDPRFGPIDEISRRRSGVLQDIRRLLDELYPEDEFGSEIRETIKILPRLGLEIDVDTQIKLAQFDDPDLYADLLHVCDVPVNVFEQGPNRESLRAAQAGIGALLILAVVATRKELYGAGFFGPGFSNSRGKRPRFVIELDGIAIDIDAGPDYADLSDLIDRYWYTCLEHFHRPSYLFERSTHARRHINELTQVIKKLTTQTGVTLSPDELRILRIRQEIIKGELTQDELVDFAGYHFVDNFRFRFEAIEREYASDHFAERILSFRGK